MSDLSILAFLPLVIALALAVVVLALAHYLLLVRRKELGSEARLPDHYPAHHSCRRHPDTPTGTAPARTG